MRFSVTAACLLGVLAGCSPAPSAVHPVSTPPVPHPAASLVLQNTLESVGLDPLAMNRSADPCVDFYEFACGKWLENVAIPADEAAWTRSFDTIHRRNEIDLRALLEEALHSTDVALNQAGTFYAACMDEQAIEAAGARPLAGVLGKIDALQTPQQLGALTAELHALGFTPLFELYPTQDPGNARRWIADLDQGGLGLPDRDYYLKTDDTTVLLRGLYQEHIQKLLELAGVPKPLAILGALDVLMFETALARISKSKEARREPKSMFNRLQRAKLAASAPAFDWQGYFNGVGLPNLTELNVTAPRFFADMDSLLRSTSLVALRSYLSFHVIRKAAPSLGKAFVDEAFQFEKALTGQAENRPRWRRCIAATDFALGDIVGKAYTEAHFTPPSKRAAEELVAAIDAAFTLELEELTWMDDATRAEAREKLETMGHLVGYPAKWKTYDFKVSADAHAANVALARASEFKRELSKIGTEVNPLEWQMTAPTVNAYYDPQRNHMVFPAGILQPPFYNVASSDTVNLGAMGMVVGHELTHGFDDEGSQYDGHGNLRDWWQPRIRERFKERTACLEQHYANYSVSDGVHVNGKLTLGENIADLGGIRLAFLAHRRLREGAPATFADGFSDDQQFFIAVGQTWCTKAHPEYERLQVATDPHSPARFRVNGPLANTVEFAEAFACKAGSPMRPENACSVW